MTKKPRNKTTSKKVATLPEKQLPNPTPLGEALHNLAGGVDQNMILFFAFSNIVINLMFTGNITTPQALTKQLENLKFSLSQEGHTKLLSSHLTLLPYPALYLIGWPIQAPYTGSSHTYQR